MIMQVVFVCFVVLALISSTVEGQTVPGLSSDFCGTDAAMANLSREQREATRVYSISPLVPSLEMLLYVHVPPQGGTTVRPGNINGTGLSSTILRQISVLPRPNLTQTQIDQIIEQVEDDFSPFNIRVTTDNSEFLAYPTGNKLIHIVSTVPQVAGFPNGTVGVAPFLGIGTRVFSNPSFLFAGSVAGSNVRDLANAMSHEVGHTLGLAHQSRFTTGCGLLEEYHPNIGGSSPLSFGILMGGAADQSISNWYSQECDSPKHGGPLHDFELINSQVVLTPDEFPDLPGSNPAGGTSLPISGILGVGGDADVIRLNIAQDASLTVTSSNIDVEVSVFETDGTPIGTFNDPNFPDVTFAVTSGAKDIVIRAASNVNMDAQFMTGKYILQQLAPTAASVNVSGSVTSHGGIAVPGAILELHGPDGIVAVIQSNPFGYFRFDDVMAGRAYVIETKHKQFQFQPILIDVTEEVTGLSIVSKPRVFTSLVSRVPNSLIR